MPKQYNIKWRGSDTTALQRAVKNFNAKLTRLIAKNPSNVRYYPEKVSIRDIKSRIATRADFNREINKLSRFSLRGAEKLTTTPTGVKLTKYERKEIGIMTGVINRKRKQEIERLGLTLEKGLKTQVKKQSLTPKKRLETVQPRDFEKFVESLEKEMASTFNKQQKEKYVSNYFKGLYNQLGAERANKIVSLLEQQSPDFIVDNSLGNPFLTIDFIYDPHEAETRANAIYEIWSSLL